MTEHNVTNILIGGNLRRAREAKGFSLAVLGPMVPLSAQQIQKYEIGENRISANILWKFSKILDVPLDYFFEKLPADQK